MLAQPRILFLTLSNDIGSDRVVSDLGRHGADCAVLGPAGCYAGLSRFVSTRLSLPRRFGVWASTVRLRHRLARIATAWRPDRVVPVDELSALLLRSIGTAPGTPAHLHDLIVRSLGRPEGYAAACHRLPLMATARQLGIRTPRFGGATERRVSFPAVVKRDHSSGSGGVALVHDAAGLAATLHRFRRRHAFKSGLAALAGYRHGAAPILIQDFVEGSLAMRTVACRDGVVLDGISFNAVQIHPEKGASTMLQPLDNPEMERAAREIVAALGCSGFVSFDFIVDRDDRAFLIEMNARPIGSTHLGRLFGHDLCAALLGETAVAAPVTIPLPAGQIVALFPKELERDPAGRGLERASAVIHDIPLDEPAVVAAYADHLAGVHPAWGDDLRRRLGAVVQPEGASQSWPLLGIPAR